MNNIEIQENLQELLYSGEQLAFLVGAGVSIPAPSNMMSGWSFNEEIISRISPDHRTKDELLTLCDAVRRDKQNKGDFLRFEGLMQILHDNVDPNLDILNCLADCDTPNENHYVLARLIEEGHYVLTTNFDVLIEHACYKLGIRCSVLITDLEFGEYSPSKYPHPLFKLHGSLKRHDGKDWVDSRHSVEATLEAVGRGVGEMLFEPGKKRVLTSILQHHDLVLMGYSGHDDFDVGPMLRTIQSDKRIIWINHDTKEKKYSWRDLENAPKDNNGDFLRKRDEYLCTLGTALAEKSPRKPQDIFLFDFNTSKAMEMLKQKHKVVVPSVGEDYDFDREKFFDDWASTLLHNDGHKFLVCGHILYSLGREANALTCYQKASEIFEELGDKRGVSISLHQRGMVHQYRAEYDQALEDYGRSLSLMKELGHSYGISKSIHEIGVIHYLKGEHEQALEDYRRSLAIKQQLGDRRGISENLHQIGMIHQDRGEYNKALENYQRGLAIKLELGHLRGVATGLCEIGMVHQTRQEHTKALENYQRSLNIFQELGDRRGIASNLHQIGIIHRRRQEYNAALESLQKSLSISLQLCDKSGIAASLHEIGTVHYLKREHNKALESYQKSLTILEGLRDKLGVANSCGQLGALYMAQNNYKDAIGYLHRAAAIFEELNSPNLHLTVRYLDSARQAIGENRFNEYLREAGKGN